MLVLILNAIIYSSLRVIINQGFLSLLFLSSQRTWFIDIESDIAYRRLEK